MLKHTVCTVKVKQPVKRKSTTKAKTPAKKPKNPKPKTKSKKRSHPEQSTESSQPPAKKAKVAKVHITRARKKSIYHSNVFNPVESIEESVEESAERKSNLAKFNEMIGDSD